ncbi:MAG: redoxin domain-containing protein [Acidimicrobiia bacterium]|nr:redoxin domain-containing protein [Acidimicrobiia bacterium]
MHRGQLIAALVAVVVGGALLVVRFSGSDGQTSVAAPSATEADAAVTGQGGDAERAGAQAGTNGAGTEGVGTNGAGADGAGAEGAGAASADPDEPERLGPARTLTGLDGWLQTEATSFEDFDGQVRIVQFWTFACYNCKNTIPHLQGIYERWQPEGLEIIGVHAPEFDFERDPEAIAVAAVDHGVIWPIALDTNKLNFRAWQPGRRFWPRTFVVDQSGEIRFDHIGEGRYDELEATVAYLVENGP